MLHHFFESISHAFNIFNFVFPILIFIFTSVGGFYYWFIHEFKQCHDIKLNHWPAVTILIPCYNEAKTIQFACQNLSTLDYPNYQIIFIDDASMDNTCSIIESYASKLPFFHLVKQTSNYGKAEAINKALTLVKTQLVFIIDADTVIHKQALKHLAKHFIANPLAGAVTSNVLTIDKTGFWGKFQAIEFSSIIGLLKRCQCLLGGIFTVSGCATMYRTEVLKRTGGFSPFTATDDIDITWRIHQQHYSVLFEPLALSFIGVPAKLSEYVKQRQRWALGGWHFLRQHFKIFKNIQLWRLWLVYGQFLISYLWAFSITFDALLLFTSIFSKNFSLKPPILYCAVGTFLFVCQTLMAIFINNRYDPFIKKCIPVLSCYPLILFWIGPYTIISTSLKGLFGYTKESGKWNSPDRSTRVSQ